MRFQTRSAWIGAVWMVAVVMMTGNLASAQASDETTFVIVRHAEKADNSQDPDLSDVGKDRAERLAAMLASLKVDAVYSTPYKRTRQTVTPTAAANGLEVQDYDPRAANPFLDGLKTQTGKVFLVAGHSNTAPLLANHLLGEEKFKALDDSVYDHVWIVTVPAQGNASVLLLHY